MIRFLGKDLLPLLLKEVPHTSCKETLKGKKGRKNKNSNDVENATWLLGNREFLFECSLSQVSEANKLDIELNMQRGISHLQATMYYYFCL